MSGSPRPGSIAEVDDVTVDGRLVRAGGTPLPPNAEDALLRRMAVHCMARGGGSLAPQNTEGERAKRLFTK